LNVELVLREPLGERSFAAGDLPVSIGGTGSDVVVPARSTGPIAWLALQDGQLFVQPASDEASVLHNGSRITGSTWLRNGDVLDAGAGRLKLRVEAHRRSLRSPRASPEQAPTRASASSRSRSGRGRYRARVMVGAGRRGALPLYSRAWRLPRSRH